MRPLAAFSLESRAGIRGVLFDIDDTLTTEGRLTADAYAAVEALKNAGLMVVPITGRPAGWCDHIARMWPVDGVVGENGAFYFYADHVEKKLKQRFVKTASERENDRRQLARVAERILREVPGAALASDQRYREADIAVDFREDVQALPREEVQRIQAIMESEGLTAKISSIHVNGWFGGYDKLSTTKLFLRERFGLDLDLHKSAFVFVGDSPNDQPMFSYFPHSVGVANVKNFLDLISTRPAYVTEAACGAGFAELANAILVSR
ncbi:MAG: HAD-IIB family hydrolase [Burkholderiales bacterium]|nr:HAD-IIB family hydrolase [Burkholderiales bacterium]